MNAVHLLFVALGGAAGSVLRVVLSGLVPTGRLPWGTLLVNGLGSLLIGWLLARVGAGDPSANRGHALLVAGFCGGFTTFSTFSWQTFEQLQSGRVILAAAHVLLAVAGCLLATWLGWRLGRL